MQTKDKRSAGKKNSDKKPASIVEVDVLCVLILYDGFDEKTILKELRKITKGGIYDA
jgi:hypothetical protein